jgi:hypothetical protein
MAISCSTVNDLFERESGRFSVDIWTRYTQDGPWGRLVRVGKFPQQMGTTLTEVTIERILSGSFEDDWTNIGTSNGTSSIGCIPAPVDLNFGQTLRTWQLQGKSYQTPCICLDDLKTSFAIRNQVGKTVDQLTMLTKTVLDNRRRSQYLSLVNVISVGNGTLTTEFASSTIAANTFPPPSAQLSQDLLDEERLILIRNGAGHNSLGKENGAPVLGLIIGADTSRQLLRNNPELRQDIRYATPSELVAPLGVERSYGGYYHLWDPEIPRFDYIGGTWVQRYPFVQSAASNGYKWEPNPLYDVAQFELGFIFHPDVYEEAVQQVGPEIPGAPFDDYPYYYSGQFFWLNIIDAVNNPLGKIGRWMGIWQSGTRPIAPYLGKALMYRRCPSDISLVGCQYYD